MHEPTTPAPRALRGTVLVVFGEPVIRRLIAVHLRHAGFFPVVAASAQDGCRLLGEMRPDALVIDIDSPTVADTPLAAAPSCTEGRHRHRLVTLVVTADPQRFNGLDPRTCGATVCVAKPFSPGELLAQLDKHLPPVQAGPGRACVPCARCCAPVRWRSTSTATSPLPIATASRRP